MSAPRSRYKQEEAARLRSTRSVRFFTVDGDIVAGASTEIEPRQAEFEALIANLDEKLAAGKKKPKAKPAGKKKPTSATPPSLKRLKPQGDLRAHPRRRLLRLRRRPLDLRPRHRRRDRP